MTKSNKKILKWQNEIKWKNYMVVEASTLFSNYLGYIETKLIIITKLQQKHENNRNIFKYKTNL